MQRFIVAPELFAIEPRPCLAVVVAEGVRGSASDPAIAARLRDEALAFAAAHEGEDVRELPQVAVWRDAFRAVGVNPGRFPSSVEALARRVQKRSELASINAVVDLVNTLSLRFVLSMGAHDLETLPGDIELRPARPDDRFVPLGGGTAETPDPGEIVYATGSVVRTRKWTWRQGEVAKVTPASRRIFFPIDAFEGVTDEAAKKAAADLRDAVERLLGARAAVAWVDREQPSCDLAVPVQA